MENQLINQSTGHRNSEKHYKQINKNNLSERVWNVFN